MFSPLQLSLKVSQAPSTIPWNCGDLRMSSNHPVVLKNNIPIDQSLMAHIEIERASDNLLRTGKGAGAMQGRRESSAMTGGAFAHQHPGYGR